MFVYYIYDQFRSRGQIYLIHLPHKFFCYVYVFIVKPRKDNYVREPILLSKSEVTDLKLFPVFIV